MTLTEISIQAVTKLETSIFNVVRYFFFKQLLYSCDERAGRWQGQQEGPWKLGALGPIPKDRKRSLDTSFNLPESQLPVIREMRGTLTTHPAKGLKGPVRKSMRSTLNSSEYAFTEVQSLTSKDTLPAL